MRNKPFWLLSFVVIIWGLFLGKTAAQPPILKLSALSPIRQGDTIRVRVLNSRGTSEIDQDFVVNTGGEIDLPVAGMFKVAGQNVPQLIKSLTAFLEKTAFKGPKVTVNAVNLVMSDRVFVFGGVKTPGPIGIRDAISIMDAIKEAGGFDLPPNDFGNSITTNYLDPKANQSAFLLSQSLDYLADTKIKRKGKELTINLKNLIQEGDISQNVDLVNDDVLIVPKRSNNSPGNDETIYVLGAVNSPARYRFREKMTVMEAISLAGGLWNPSHVKYANIIRGVKNASPTKDLGKTTPKQAPTQAPKPEIIKVDLRRLLYRADLTNDQMLKASDVLLVSTRENRSFLSDLGKFVDNFLPIINRMDSVVGYDDSIRRFNDRFLK